MLVGLLDPCFVFVFLKFVIIATIEIEPLIDVYFIPMSTKTDHIHVSYGLFTSVRANFLIKVRFTKI